MFLFSRFKIFRSLMIPVLENLTSYEVKDSVFDELDVDNAVKSLKMDGCYEGIVIPPDCLDRLLKFAYDSKCYANRARDIDFHYARRDEAEKQYDQSFISAEYFDSILRCPDIWKLSHDPKILEIASQYLGGKPLCVGSRLWWLFAKEEEEKTLLMSKMNFLYLRNTIREGSYFFHYDLDDYRCLKFFFYLTEVDHSGGPHCCVHRSHIRKKISHLLSLSRRCPDQDIQEFYGSEAIKTICGEPGFGFVEDTFCFHKATIPSAKDRLMLVIQFNLNDYGNQTETISIGTV